MHVLVPLTNASEIICRVTVWMSNTMIADPFKDTPVCSPEHRRILERVIGGAVVDTTAPPLTIIWAVYSEVR